MECGTGQGLKHSGDVADVAFYNLAEAGFVDVEQICRDHGLLLYLRFRDDILMVFEKTAATVGKSKQFVYELQKRAGFYKLQVEDSSMHHVTFLNMHV